MKDICVFFCSLKQETFKMAQDGPNKDVVYL